MSGLRKARRIRLIALAAVALAGSTTLIGFAMRDGIQFFRTPSQALADARDTREVFRLGGMVVQDSLLRAGTEISFHLTDGTSSIPVSYTGLVPDLFAEGEGAIATGSLVDGTFRATQILAKHDEDYMPRELADIRMEPSPKPGGR